MKKVLFTRRNDHPHWVGDGFSVRTLFSYNDSPKEVSPFLLLDYAGPTEFDATTQRRGVGSHPHRGFETVTIVYDGEVEHRDSAGGGGVIGPGDVQWMTAASGLIHEEFHGQNFAKKGGPFEMVQLWVNLPKKDKMSKPRYQTIKNKMIPKVNLPDNVGSLAVIAGEFEESRGPAKTFTPMNLWDLRLKKGAEFKLNVPKKHNALIFLLSGDLQVADTHNLKDAEIAFLEREGNSVILKANEDSKILFLGGEVIDEPVFGYGPFVMNTKNEIIEAIKDFEAGKMGMIGGVEGSKT